MTQAIERDNEGSATQGLIDVPRRFGRAEIEPVAQALARAFYDDPMIMYIWPETDTRRKMLPIFMRGAAKLALPQQQCFTTPGLPEGGALFLPPGQSKIPFIPMLQVMLPDMWRWRPGALRRFLGIMDEFEKKHPKHDHWYLMVLGVDPPRQGQGVGGALISGILARADSERRDVYLETLKARNVTFYEKHGFVVVEHFDCHGGRGPECWTMLRAPRG